MLYLVLARVWASIVGPLAGFTLSVHLFSAFCAAGAAAVLALAARDFLRRIRPQGPSDAPAIAAAMISAAGYCFWNASTLAKPYALYYLTLSILLWILVRAERRGDFLALGAILGLSWAAHPSAAMLVPAMLAYAWARRDKVRELGAARFAGVILVAAAAAFAPSFIGLPILSARESMCSMGDARTPAQVWSHLRGANYTDFRGAWGFSLARAVLAARFVWEEFLGIGLAILGIGLWRMIRECPRILALVGIWAGPMFLLPLVFIGEGMFDQWFVAAYVPLSLCTATGFAWIAQRRPPAFYASLAGGIAWMIIANFADLNFRGYTLAEDYGRALLAPLEPGAIFIASTDDAAVLPMYLQRVKGVRPDVRLVLGEFVGLDWYDRRLERDRGVRRANLAEISARTNPQLLTVTAIANANVSPGHPVYSERPPDPHGLRPGLVQIAAGVLWKTAVDSERAGGASAGESPGDPSAIARLRRRARGIFMRHTATGMVAAYEPYEDRLVDLLVQAELRGMEPRLAGNPAAAVALYDRVAALDPPLEVDAAFQYNYGLALYLVNRYPPAEEAFVKVLALEPAPKRRTMAHFYLGEIARETHRPEEAHRQYRRALEINGAEPAIMDEIRRRSRQP